MGEPPLSLESQSYPVDDSMIIPPPAHRDRVSIRMGPNIKPLPAIEPLKDELKLTLLIKLGDNISTDDILPGGAKVLPFRTNFPAISQYVFSRLDPEFARRAQAAGNGAILGGENYGQGSSREHAALILQYLGVRAVFARSFARLHRANLINFGLLPSLITAEDYQHLAPGDRLELKGMREAVAGSQDLTLRIPEKNLEIKGRLTLTRREREILLCGGRLNQVRKKLKGQIRDE
jgi:aconitate hydratase